MALVSIDHFSQVLGMSMTCNVILPEQAPGQIGMAASSALPGESDRYPTLWLLHGRSDDHSVWLRRTSIERYLAPLGVAAVMPNVHLSRYANMAYGGRYWDYVSEELPALLERWLPIATHRNQRYVAGLSMGGWGTMKLALNHPDRFCAAACLSATLRLDPAQWLAERKADPELDRYLTIVFGPDPGFPNPEDRLLERLADHLARGTELPRLFACCGTEDFLVEDNRAVVAKFREMGVSIHYEEGPGTHEWGFWDGWIRRALAWMGFPIEPPDLGSVVR